MTMLSTENEYIYIESSYVLLEEEKEVTMTLYILDN